MGMEVEFKQIFIQYACWAAAILDALAFCWKKILGLVIALSDRQGSELLREAHRRHWQHLDSFAQRERMMRTYSSVRDKRQGAWRPEYWSFLFHAHDRSRETTQMDTSTVNSGVHFRGGSQKPLCRRRSWYPYSLSSSPWSSLSLPLKHDRMDAWKRSYAKKMLLRRGTESTPCGLLKLPNKQDCVIPSKWQNDISWWE